MNKKTSPATWNDLSDAETRVIVDKGTERPHIGEFVNNHEEGVYMCRRCDAHLYKSESKFESGCGWPAFDEMIKGSVQEIPDSDGSRTEIVCHNCKGHLGHVFKGEQFTETNERHCVNSISMKFQSSM